MTDRRTRSDSIAWTVHMGDVYLKADDLQRYFDRDFIDRYLNPNDQTPPDVARARAETAMVIRANLNEIQQLREEQSHARDEDSR